MERARLKVAKVLRARGLIKLLIGLVASCLFVSIIALTRTYKVKLKEGDVCQASIYAPFDFSYVDGAATSAKKEAQAADVRDVYTIDPKVSEGVLKDIDSFYERISGFEEAERDEVTGLAISNLLALLKTGKQDELRQRSKEIAQSVMAKGLLSSSLKAELGEKGVTSITICDLSSGAEIEKGVAQISTVEDARKEAAEIVQKSLPYERRASKEVGDLIQQFLRSNLFYDEQKTLVHRQIAMEKVSSVLRSVKKGELIVDKGEIIAADHIIQLDALAKLEVRREALSSISGISLLVTIFVGLMGAYLYRYAPKIFNDDRRLMLIGLAIFSSMVLAKLMTFSQLPSELISISCSSMLILSPMLITILLEPGVAVMATVVLAVFAGIMSANILPPVLITFVGGLVGIYSVMGIRRRWQLIRAGVLVGLASLVCIVGIGLLERQDPRAFMTSAAWGLTGGIIASLIVTGALPIFESLFKITTDISLLELSDLNHPVLRRLIQEAPGTYHHSLIVGNLAESAAEEVGANPLFARVASYYHDIGKIEKAEYFSENQPKGERRRSLDKLTPTMSSLIIINHVKKGVELARKYKLNQAIVDVIREHHGTSQVFFFYLRALERVEDEEELKRLEFRYPGPKPQTKESAIVLLADSIEAASRTLSEPTPSSIKGMVRKIINNKFIDGQLEECELTLKNLNAIADSFVRILTGIFHTRVEYPEARELRISKAIRSHEDKSKRSPVDRQGKTSPG